MSNESHEGSSPLASRSGRGAGGEGPETKRCPKCGETKPLDAFYKARSRKDGHHSHCKACQCEYSRSRRATHPEVVRQIRRASYAANADRIREYARKYKRASYAANADRIREYQREYNVAYRIAHPEYNGAYRAAHPDQRRAYGVVYRAAHPNVRRAADQRRRALKKGNGGVGFTAQELLHMQRVQGGFCAYCQYQYGDTLTIDHIIPLKQGGLHEAANICLACPKCNFSKGNRTPDQWVNRWYYHKNE